MPAGALGDIFDRRRLLFCSQSATAITIALIAMLTLKGLVGPVVLLIASVLCGAFSTISATTSDAILPQIVERGDFSAAIALMGFRYQFSRAIGPILGGVLIAYASIGHAFLMASVAPFGTLAFLWIWHPTREAAAFPAERVTAALRAGIRYVRYAPQLTAVMIRVVAFIGVGSAMWGLLPVYVHHYLKLDALQYGILFGCFGLGGMLGSVMAFSINRSASEEVVLAAATIAFALNLFLITRMRDPFSLALMLFFGGFAWSAGMINLETAVQMAAPDWVRARISAIYLLVLNGSVAAGSASWGLVASYYGTSHALRYAGVAMIATLALGLRFRLAAIATVKQDRSIPRLAPIELPVAAAPEGMPILLTMARRRLPGINSRCMDSVPASLRARRTLCRRRYRRSLPNPSPDVRDPRARSSADSMADPTPGRRRLPILRAIPAASAARPARSMRPCRSPGRSASS